MTLYDHSFDTANNKITITAVEVVETPKTYKLVKPYSIRIATRCIKKADIDKFTTKYGLYMASLQPSVEKFTEHLKCYFEAQRDYHQDSAELAQGMLDVIERGYFTVQEAGVGND